MASLYNNSVTRYWNFLFVELADPRTNDWFLIKSPLPGLTIIGLYLYFVISWGPRWMQDRKPFVLKNTLILYNFFQVCVSCYLVFEAFDGLWLQPGFSFRCSSVDFTVNPLSIRQASGVHVYFLAKITELLDTVFFVLRKKQNQITFLHLYHHTVMPMISWGCTKYYPGGHGTFVGAINSFVHIIMYSYYMLAAFGPKLQPYLWWKKYITVLQMFQFLLVFLHQIQLLWVPCDYPLFSLYITLPNAGFFLYLFNDFYVKSYKENRVKVKEEEMKRQAKAAAAQSIKVSEGTELRYRGTELAQNGHNKANGHANGASNGGSMSNGSAMQEVKFTNGSLISSTETKTLKEEIISGYNHKTINGLKNDDAKSQPNGLVNREVVNVISGLTN